MTYCLPGRRVARQHSLAVAAFARGVVEVGADGARGQLEPTGDLLVRPPFEIVQQHHLALRLGELRQCRDDPVAKLAALQLRGGGFFAGQLVQLKRLGRSDRVMPDQVTGRFADDLEQPAAELGGIGSCRSARSPR
jgi:hypothetical protein